MKAPRRPRQTRLLPRFCVCGVALLAVTGFFSLADVTDSHVSAVNQDISLSKRELKDNKTDRISRSAISDFPEDIFTPEQRRHGAVLLHVLAAIYMFHALAIVCEFYFVPSLEKVSENLHLSQDVAGATFMAAGSSAPELFTSLIGVFITKGDVGVGTIVGSAVFNILVIIGLCGIFSGQTISLSWWPLFRDAVFYILSIVVLITVIYDEKVMWWETIILISMYGIYITIMKFNGPLCRLAERHFTRAGQPCLGSLRRTAAVGSIGDCDNDMVPLKPGGGSPACTRDSTDPVTHLGPNSQTHFCRPVDFQTKIDLTVLFVPTHTHTHTHAHTLPPDSCVVAGQDSGAATVDDMLKLHPHQLSFSERQRLILTRGGPEEGVASGEGGVGANGTASEGDGQPPEEEKEGDKETGGESGGGAPPKEEEEQEREEGEEEDSPYEPFVLPGGWCMRLKWLLSWPLSVLLHFTIPNCARPRWERWYLLTFLSSTLWIAIYSYLMVWMVTIISYTLGIPEVIMGITFLAAGTSVPDCMASLIVARQGMGDMAVSNSIGSNIFDVLLGLGFPWALRTLIVSYGSVVTINSKGLVYSVILLLASVILTVMCVHLNSWRLDRRLGLCLILFYAIFLLCSVGFERL